MTAVEQVRGWFAQHRHEQSRASVIARSLGAEHDTVVQAMDELLRSGELVGARVTRGDGSRDIDARLALSRSGQVMAPSFNGPVVAGRVIVPRPTAGGRAAPAAVESPPGPTAEPGAKPTPKQQSALDVLLTDGPQLVSGVASLLGATESATAYLLRQLERKGLAESVPDQGLKRLWRAVGVDVEPSAIAARNIPQSIPPAAPRPTLNVDDAVRSVNETMRQLEEGAREEADRQRRTAHAQALAGTPLTAVLGCNGSLQLRRGEATFDVLPKDVPDLYRIACAARVLTEGL